MRWKGGEQSENVEDRRGQSAGMGRGAKLGGGAILIAVVAVLLGADPRQVMQALQQQSAPAGGGAPSTATRGGKPDPADSSAEFVSVVLADTEKTWTKIFSEGGGQYEKPKLILFANEVDSACGLTSSAVGPFYCPGDHQVYLDTSFFRELHEQFGAPGDFAQAYVIAHEVGHHVQNLLGTSDKVDEASAKAQKAVRNALSVKLELQADCFAGVWGFHANRERKMLEPGDVEEGLRAAAAIGDDRLQREAGQSVRPESWTHGASEERVFWLRRGLESGRIDACDTFSQ